MHRSRVRMLLVADPAGRAIGVLEPRSIALRTDARSVEVMHAPLVSLRESASIYDALALHFEYGVRFLAVLDSQGALRGAVDVDDLLHEQYSAPVFLITRLKTAASGPEIARCHSALTVYLRAMIAQGSSTWTVMRTAAAVSDSLLRRLVELAIQELGTPPAAFVFLSLGSEGRREQTLASDQDNALLWDDGDPDNYDEHHRYFLQLGERVCSALDAAGYPYCRGNVMAKNPKWCQPLSRWKEYFSEWVTAAEPQNLLDVSIFFDFRAVAGDASLADALRAHLFRVSTGNHSFLAYLSINALKTKPPIWQLKAQEPLDTKLSLLPVVDLARVYALKHKVHDTNTLDRLLRIHEAGSITTGGYRELTQAYTLVMGLRLREQATQLAVNVPANNLVPTSTLTELERVSLRRALTSIEEIQAKLSLDFKGTL